MNNKENASRRSFIRQASLGLGVGIVGLSNPLNASGAIAGSVRVDTIVSHHSVSTSLPLYALILNQYIVYESRLVNAVVSPGKVMVLAMTAKVLNVER